MRTAKKMLTELREIRRELSTQKTMTPTTDFNDLTPPDDLMERWAGDFGGLIHAARWGARHGWEQARQLWPEPITDRPPTEADGDDAGYVHFINESGRWNYGNWAQVAEWKLPWQHISRWQPRQPSLQKQALALLPYDPQAGTVTLNSVEVLKIRRALVEQAGEGQR
jgi:hypothetical protein